MALKTIFDKKEDIPERFQELYTERDGKWELTGIAGTKTQADVDRVQLSLEKERKAHKETKTKLSAFGELDPDEIHTKLDRFDELEASSGDKVDEDKINALVEARIKTKIGPLERENNQLKEQALERDTTIEEYETKDIRRQIHDSVRKSAIEIKVLDTAMEDVLMLSERIFEVNEEGHVIAKDGVGVTPGIDPSIWFTEIQDKRPHWWPHSSGSGAGGSGPGGGFSNNPFSAAHWNMTEQGQIMRTQGRDKAEQMAKAAGTTIGGLKPEATK